jgi:alcohol dehydrogenase
MRLPDHLPPEVACPANCATGTAAAAIAAAGTLARSTVCVLGVGLVGLTTCAMASAAGAGAIVCVDPHDGRRELSRLFGATATSRPEGLARIAADITGSEGFDVVFECAGPSANLPIALEQARLGGTVVLVGSTFPDVPVPVGVDQLVRRNLTIRGVHNYTPSDLRRAVEFLAVHHHSMPFAGLVAPWIPLRQIGHAFRTAALGHSLRVGVSMA